MEAGRTLYVSCRESGAMGCGVVVHWASFGGYLEQVWPRPYQFCMSYTERVQANTADSVNQQIENATRRRIRHAGGETRTQLTRRIEELDQEWDIERILEMNASSLAFSGLVLGLFVNRKFLWVPAIVLPFLLQHALQGWCPPIPLLRRRGVRTRREIDAEKFALKTLRGDFAGVPLNADPLDRARAAWEAAQA
jgi:hypothetical protein